MINVWRLVAHLAGRDLAEDLTQETFLRALRALPAYRGDAAAKTWLLSIARRAAADAIRGAERRRRLLGRLRPAPNVPEAGRPALVEQLLSLLDPDRRAAFVLTQLLGLTYAEAPPLRRQSSGSRRGVALSTRSPVLAAPVSPHRP